MIDPMLRDVGINITWHRTGLQKDSASCGFWCLLFLSAPLFNIDIEDTRVRSLEVGRLKAIFQEIWVAYVRDPVGLRTQVVHKLFGPLGADVLWQDFGEMVSSGTLDRAERGG